jgi:BirA family biotin operon repressor/biotin-[acetyl-CoA-carboxylase] ligase
MIFGEPLFALDIVGSTQDVARAQWHRRSPPGTVITARAMEAGRGRRGRLWVAPRDSGVLLTAIGGPVPPDRLWQLAPLTGVAVAQAVGALAPTCAPRVKFPNDVLIDGKKLSGVLIEAISQTDGTQIPLIGIGINVRAVVLPEPLEHTATSIEAASGIVLPIETVRDAVLQRLGRLWELWEADGTAAFVADWNRLQDRAVARAFVLDGQPTLCQVLDLAADGTVTIETQSGSVYRVPAPQVVLGAD